MVRSLTWALECDRPQRRRSVLLQVLEVDLEEGRRCTRRSFDEAGSNVLVNRQDQVHAPNSDMCEWRRVYEDHVRASRGDLRKPRGGKNISFQVDSRRVLLAISEGRLCKIRPTMQVVPNACRLA